jgi:enhancing lycopene biosynthesis protein 2
MKRVGIILSGCGFLDGSEIQECVLTLVALSRMGAQVVAFAPAESQKDVVNHHTHKKMKESRNILIEASRIVRGAIKPLDEARWQDLDALVIPGGYGVAKNLCNFDDAKAKMQVHPQVERLISDCHREKKPLGAICIAPILLARVLSAHKPKVTLGMDEDLAGIIREWGAEHVSAAIDEIVVDDFNRIVTTPAFMLEGPLALIEKGITSVVQEIVRLA